MGPTRYSSIHPSNYLHFEGSSSAADYDEIISLNIGYFLLSAMTIDYGGKSKLSEAFYRKLSILVIVLCYCAESRQRHLIPITIGSKICPQVCGFRSFTAKVVYISGTKLSSIIRHGADIANRLNLTDRMPELDRSESSRPVSQLVMNRVYHVDQSGTVTTFFRDRCETGAGTYEVTVLSQIRP